MSLWYQKLGLKYPVFQGGMAWASNPELVAAVSNSGALGIIGSGGRSAQQLQKMITQVKELTKSAFGVNLMLQDDNIEELCKVICYEKVRVVTTGAGTPKLYLAALNQAGCQVFSVVPSATIALKMFALPIAGVIVEGQLAGGHVGDFQTKELVQQLALKTAKPILAAGGIYDYQDALAMYNLGAAGIQAGTIFLAAQECQLHPNYRQLLIKSHPKATLIRISQNGYRARVLKLAVKNQNMSLRLAVQAGDLERGAFMAGEVAARITRIEPAAKIVERLTNAKCD
ncbi:NAD(P)H-dependent flavin oxidoreductase [Liquorilactobacillus satsumensis]|uniref:NAD(P)H-dependent flavin oxidoreductase n=1 Tax=Liquorilactobacillus satsumensis TaxID=259059 RepID=UPI0039E74330